MCRGQFLLCASSSSDDSKTLPQMVHRCCLGLLDPAVAADMGMSSNTALLKVSDVNTKEATLFSFCNIYCFHDNHVTLH